MIEDNRKEGKDILEQSQLVMLRLLRIVDEVCTSNGLNYWLDSGTLLGAVRHGGFIPWDDDIDICMPREDYNKFINIASALLPSDLFLQNKDTDPNYPFYFSKVRDNNSTIIENEKEYEEVVYHQGIFLDIFPVDYVDDVEPFLRDKRLFMRDFNAKSKKNTLKKVKAYLMNYYSQILVKVVGKDNLLRSISEKYKYSDGKYIIKGVELPFEVVLEKEKLLPLGVIEFEGYTFSAPKDVEYYLSTMYGDYMKLPRVEDRHTHAIELFPTIPYSNRIPH
jgi:lipopolysaccharide cholinephosphotransferase